MTHTEDYLLALKGSITIVGNGTILNKGAVIDSYDNVIRVNGFHIAGYEQHVGTKLTLWSTYGDILPPKIAWISSVPAVSPFHIDDAESVQREHFIGRLVYARTRSADIRLVAKPTTGTMLITLCNKLGLAITIFGFDGFKTGHYFNDYDPKDPALTGAQHWHTEVLKELDLLLKSPGIIVG